MPKTLPLILQKPADDAALNDALARAGRNAAYWPGKAASSEADADEAVLSVTGDFTIGLGDGLVFLCAIFFSAHILYLDYASRRYPPLEIAAGQFLVCGLINTFIAIPVETIHLDAILSAWWPILYVGIFSTGIAYTLQIVSQKHLPPTECSMILSLEMVFGGLSGVLALGETMTAKEMAGVLCMTIGVFWSQLPSRGLCRLKGLIKNPSHH